LTTPYLRIRVFGDEIVSRKLRHGARTAVNMEPALQDVADDMMEVVFATFMSQGRRYGGSWAAIDPKWVARKAKKGWDTRILLAQNFLIDSWTNRGDENQHLDVDGKRIVLDSTLDYAEVHQFGGGRNIPARPYVNFYPQDRKRWVKMCQEHLVNAIRYGT
jgi:phage gpG-like protein